MARIRYSWTGRPKNISRKEYERYALLQFGMVASGGFCLLCLISLIFRLPDKLSSDLATIPRWPVDKVSNYEGDRTQPLKFEGRIIAEPPTPMTDDPNQEVVTGNVELILEAKDDELEPFFLLQWENKAPNVYLEQAGQRIPFKLDLSILPLETDRSRDWSFIYEGENARLREPVAVEYQGGRYPFPPAYLNLSDRPSITLNRTFFTNGTLVTVVAGLESTEDGPQIVPPLGKKPQVYRGTEDEIYSQGKSMYPMLIGLALATGGTCYWLIQRFQIVREDFIRRSNL